MIELKKRLQTEIAKRLQEAFSPLPGELELTETPDHKFGDLALSFPFQAARRLRQAPRVTAEKAVAMLSGLEGVERIEVAGAGYINLFLDRKSLFGELLSDPGRSGLAPEESKILVEHTNINPNKAAHIGHIRNACLGDTLVRCLRFKGEDVEAQNYIDDTGVQVVDIVYAFMELEPRTIADLEAMEGRFDHYCWDVYTRVSSYLAGHPEARARKSEIIKKVEHGEGPEFEMAMYVSRRIVRAHLATMKRLGISYDVLPCESAILRLNFWEKAYSLLKEKKAIYFVGEGESAGCWVMKLEDEADREKIIVRSDGTVTYVGKDIAYQLWKFGLLGLDFRYEPFIEDDGRTVWIATSESGPSTYGPESGLSFGRAGKVYNVIDVRQSYLQKVVVQGVKALGYPAQAEKSVHFSYEMVALSTNSLKELDYTPTEEEKAFHEVSGRKGLGVKADDLIDRLEEKALAEVEKRNPDSPAEDKKETARRIAAGALRYFMLKYARNTLIVFDFDEALSFEGETGPYLQYSVVRLGSIFRKLRERTGETEAGILAAAGTTLQAMDSIPDREKSDLWDLVFMAANLDEAVISSINTLELGHLAKYAFALSQKVNGYYHQYQILSEEDPAVRGLRLLTISYARKRLAMALELMGVPVPERM